MSESNLLRSLGQVSSDQVGEVFREYLRGSVRQMIVDAMDAGVARGTFVAGRFRRFFA